MDDIEFTVSVLGEDKIVELGLLEKLLLLREDHEVFDVRIPDIGVVLRLEL